MAAVGKTLKLRLFLEGEEVPVISASVQAGMNAPCAASIQIVPLDEAMDFKPRTMVHLFFLDSRSQQNGLGGEYLLLFGGEVVGYQIAQTPMSRAHILQCVDFSSYWDAAQATSLDYNTGGNFTNIGAVFGSNVGVFDDVINHQPHKLVNWLGQRPETPGLKSVSGLAGGVIRMLEGVSGITGSSKGVNDFFTVAELRCRVLAQIAAEENDQTAKNLLSMKVFNEWVRRGLQNIGTQVTFRDILKLLFRYIHYEFVSNPTPKFTDAKTSTSSSKIEPVDLKADKTILGVISALDEITAGISARMADPNGYSIASGGVVTLTSWRSSLQKKQGALKGYPDKNVQSASGELGNAISKLGALAKQPLKSWKDFEPAQQNIERAKKFLGAVSGRTTKKVTTTSGGQSQRLHAHIIRPDCWFAPPPTCNVLFPEHYTRLGFERNYLSEVSRVFIQFTNTLISNGQQDGLFSTKILAPNYQQASKYLGKYGAGIGTYRILMDHERHAGIIARTEWLPDTSAVNKDLADSDKKKVKAARVTWGERVALFNFFKYRFAGRSLRIDARFNPYVVCGFPGAVIRSPYIPFNEVEQTPAQEKSDYQFAMDHPEELGAPYQFVGMVAGVSHAINQDGGLTSVYMHHVRRHYGSDDEFVNVALQSAAQSQSTVETVVRVELNYDTLSKGIASEEDSTLAYTWTPEEMKLINALVGATYQGTVQEDTAASTTAITASTVLATMLQLEVNPGTGVLETKTVTSPNTVRTQTPATNPTQRAPARTQFTQFGDGTDQRQGLAPSPSGARTKAGEKGLLGGVIQAVEVLNPSVVDVPGRGKAFRQIAIYEKIKVPVENRIPIEDVIRPRGWFSPKYGNTRIGQQIYDPFFGCLSIIDDLRMQMGETVLTQSLADTPETPVVVNPNNSVVVIGDIGRIEGERLKYTVEKALTSLAYIYGKVRSEGGDVDEFIRQYTWRPIATMQQMLGDEDLQLAVSGTTATVAPGSKGQFIGFHTMAIHPAVVDKGDLVGLVTDPTMGLYRLNKEGKMDAIPPPYDVRKEKKDRVRAYVAALKRGPGFRG